MTRTHRFLGGVSLGYLLLVLATVVGLWLTPFLLRNIGPNDLGLWLITTQILGYLMLLDLGVVALAPRETAFATGRAIGGGTDETALIFAKFRTVVRWQVLPATVVCAIAWWAVTLRWPELRWPLATILVAFLFSFPARLYRATLQGLQDLTYLGKVQLIAWTAGTIVTIGLVLVNAGLVALAAGWVATQLITSIACGLRLRNHFDPIFHAPDAGTSMTEVRELFQRSGWVSATQIGQVFLNGSDVLVLGAVLGPAATVPYACTAKLITVLSNHPQLLMQAAGPALAEMRSSVPRAQLARVALALTRAMLILSGGVACFVLAANRPFVDWWVGAEQFAGMRLTLLLLAAMLCRHFATTMTYALFSFGHERRLSLTAITDGVVTLVVTAFLVSFTGLGLISAPIGSLAGVLLVTIPACGIALARELEVTPLALLSSQRGWAIRFAVASTITFLAARFLEGYGTAGLVGIAVQAAIVYAALMWPLALEAPLGPYVRSGLVSVGGWLGFRPALAVEPRA